MNRSRNWLLTINYKEDTPTNNDELLDYIKDIKSLTYTAFQLEQGEKRYKTSSNIYQLWTCQVIWNNQKIFSKSTHWSNERNTRAS